MVGQTAPLPARSRVVADVLAHAALPVGGLEEGMRVRLAASPDTSPDLLCVLAQDSRLTVRAAVALNRAAPPAVDALLARDNDERIRALLAQKLATLIPALSRRDRVRLQDQAMVTLAGLVEDEAERVRQAIAEAVKEMPDAPRELILRLAHDASVPVSEPILRLSPVLTPADLLSLLANPSHQGVASAIASRRRLEPEVAGAIAASDDRDAITALLANESAQLREAALDALVGRAPPEEAWHAPLVHRPQLSNRAAKALSEFVAGHLLTVLASRADLDPETMAHLKRKLAAKLGGQTTGREAVAACTPEQAMTVARDLHAAGKLDAAAVHGALHAGDTRLCCAILAIAAEVPLGVVERAAAMRSAKGVVSLVWMAGFPEEVSAPLQALVGRVAPSAVLRGPNGRDFPLAVEEMRWQVDLLKRMGR